MAIDTTTLAGRYIPAAADGHSYVRVQGEVVTAEVDNNGQYRVYAGTEMVANGELNGTEGDLMVFFEAEAILWSLGVDEYRDEMAAAELALFEAEVTAAPEVFTPAVELIRKSGRGKVEEADRMMVGLTDAPIKLDRTEGRRGRRTIGSNDPRHPMQAAMQHRREAEVLADWTNDIEARYGKYVADGLADTDGHFAPLGRAAWMLAGGR